MAGEIRGSARATYELRGHHALSVLTEGWTEEEKQNLLADDPEAKDALKSALLARTLTAPDECETFDFEIRIELPPDHDLKEER